MPADAVPIANNSVDATTPVPTVARMIFRPSRLIDFEQRIEVALSWWWMPSEVGCLVQSWSRCRAELRTMNGDQSINGGERRATGAFGGVDRVAGSKI